MEKALSVKGNRRIGYFDILKGLGIILVVWGHCIQYGNGDEFVSMDMYFGNSLFQFIYSFHMPLFMFVSGYLFFFSLQRHSTKGLFRSKFRALVVPALTYAVVTFIITRYWRIATSPFAMVEYVLVQMWFLWSVFYSSIIVLVVHRWFNDKFAIHAILMILTFVTPDILNLGLYKWTYFYFVAGYYMNRHIDCLQRYKKYTMPTFVVITLLFLLMFLFYDRNMFIYTTGMIILQRTSSTLEVCTQLYYDIFRIAIGFLGTFSVCLLILLSKRFFDKFSNINRVIIVLGKNSLGIYFFQSFIVGYILTRLTKPFTYSISAPVCETAIVLAVCMLCIYCVKRFRITRILILGMKE